MRRFLTACSVALALAAVWAQAASANPSQFSIMMDDDQLLYRGDDARDAALRRMKSLGVDYVRVTVLWSIVAEHAKVDRQGKRRKNFKADNPRTYVKGKWDRYDRLVRAGATLGIGIYFNVTGPGPPWAHKKPPKAQRALRRTWKPKTTEFRSFVKAVGRRYDGAYRDENDGAKILPRVSFWSIYNEPNQPGWLTPQWEKKGAKVVPASPALYRELYYSGRAALQATGHGSDVILIGETAPLGSGQQNVKSPIRPKRFIREFFCVSSTGAKYSGSAASKRGCSKLKKTSYTAWAHHPYTKDLPPTQRDKNKDSISMANISELTALLDQMGKKTGKVSPDRNASMLTEFGYETDPPDPFSGIAPEKQAEYINVADYIAYRDPRIFGNTQFLLRDVDPIKRAKKDSKRYWFTYQSGLLFANGQPKPSATAYALPLVVTGTGVDSVGAAGVTFWGQLRFLPNNVASQVSLQYKPAGAADFSTIGDPVPVNSFYGFFEAQRSVPQPGTWRAVWVNPVDGHTIVSREVLIAV